MSAATTCAAVVMATPGVLVARLTVMSFPTTVTVSGLLGALLGLVPVPYRSDQAVRDQGISKAGRAELRRMWLQSAWGWLRWQPHSALTHWFQRRFGAAGGRSERIGIVALARKLAIALWRSGQHGAMPEGATVKA